MPACSNARTNEKSRRMDRASPAGGSRERMIKKPLISVVIPVFNLEAYLGEAVDSVLNQTCREFEIILVDDGSTDRSLEIMRGYQLRLPEKVRAISREHLGAAAARNAGIAAAAGEWIAFLDGDDVWKPGKLEKQLRASNMDPRANFIYTAAEIHGQSKLLPQWVPQGHEVKLGLLLKGCFIILSTVLLRRELLGAAPFDEGLPGAQDLDLFLRLADQGLFRFIPEPLIRYRIRANAISDPQTTRYQQLGHHYRIVKHETEKMAQTDPGQFRLHEKELGSVRARLSHEAAYFSLFSRKATCPERVGMSWSAIREDPGRLKNYRLLLQALLPKQLNLWLLRSRNR
jgi:glycosyltransferase involved in cell wall biosynthesis